MSATAASSRPPWPTSATPAKRSTSRKGGNTGVAQQNRARMTGSSEVARTLTHLKQDLQATRDAQAANVRAMRQTQPQVSQQRTKSTSSKKKKKPTSSGSGIIGGPHHTTDAHAHIHATSGHIGAVQPVSESDLLDTIAAKQRALDASKAELERSLAATRAMEAKFSDARRQMRDAAAWERERNRPNAEYWSPTHQQRKEEAKELATTQPAPSPYSWNAEPMKPWRTAAGNKLLSRTPRSHYHPNPATVSAKRSAVRPPTPQQQSNDEVDPVALLRALPATKKTVLDLFRNYDVHCTGAVNANEFAAGLSQAGLALSSKQVAGLIRTLDRENRGQIRYINLIETTSDESSATTANRASTDSGSANTVTNAASELPERLFAPAPAPQHPAVYVPIPPYDSFDPAVAQARASRSQPSRAVAITRASERAMRQADGTFVRVGHQLPELAAHLRTRATSQASYAPRPIGFVEKEYAYALGPSNIVDNPLVHPYDLRASNSQGWGGERIDLPRDDTQHDGTSLRRDSNRAVVDGAASIRPKAGEYGRDYHQALLDPTSTTGASLRALSERIQHEPRRFAAMMRTLDADADDIVTHKEFVAGLERLGLNVPSWRVQALLKDVDRHGTGGVKYEEVAGLLEQYASAGRTEQQAYEAAKAAARPSSQPSPFAPGFKSSLSMPLHTQPTWLASPGLGNNVAMFTEARRVEREWEAKHERELDQAAAVAAGTTPAQPKVATPAVESQRNDRISAASQTMQQAQQAQQAPSTLTPRPIEPQFEAWSESPQVRQQHQQHEQQEYEQDLQYYRAAAQPDSRQYHPEPEAHPPTVEAPAAPQRASVSAAATPRMAHYPYLHRTSDEIARMKEMQQQQQRQQAHSNDQSNVPESQVGTPLPVLPVEYPPLKASTLRAHDREQQRARTPGPESRRAYGGGGRSRSNSVASVRSMRSQTPSVRSQATGFGGGSRRGSFSQVPRNGLEHPDQNRYARIAQTQELYGRHSSRRSSRQYESNPSLYWPDQRDSIVSGSATPLATTERIGRARTRDLDVPATPTRRSASVSAPPAVVSSPSAAPAGEASGANEFAAALPVDQYGSSADADFFKILKLAQSAPLSTKVRAMLASGSFDATSAAMHESSAQPSPSSEVAFPVHHAASPSPSPAASMTVHASSPVHTRSRSASVSIPGTPRSNLDYAPPSSQPQPTHAQFALSGRARDFYHGSGFHIGW